MGFGSKSDNNNLLADNRPIFIGGFNGTYKSKKDGSDVPFYSLNFAYTDGKEWDNSFGWRVATCYVAQEVYQKFLTSGKVLEKVDAQIFYGDHKHFLVSYNL